MKTTPNLGLPYPEAADPPNVPSDMSALANKLDTIIPNLESGYWNALTEIKAVSSSWEMAWFHGAKSFVLVSIGIGFYYRGTNPLRGDANGNIADTHIATIQRTVLRPPTTFSGLLTTADTMVHLIINSSGQIILRGFPNGTQSIAKNEGCNVTLAYPAP